MTPPSRRRQVVQDLQTAYRVSERCACAVTRFARSKQRRLLVAGRRSRITEIRAAWDTISPGRTTTPRFSRSPEI